MDKSFSSFLQLLSGSSGLEDKRFKPFTIYLLFLLRTIIVFVLLFLFAYYHFKGAYYHNLLSFTTGKVLALLEEPNETCIVSSLSTTYVLNIVKGRTPLGYRYCIPTGIFYASLCLLLALIISTPKGRGYLKRIKIIFLSIPILFAFHASYLLVVSILLKTYPSWLDIESYFTDICVDMVVFLFPLLIWGFFYYDTILKPIERTREGEEG